MKTPGSLLLVTICIVLSCNDAEARDLHYGSVTDASIARCDEAHWRGQIDDAAACYSDVMNGDAPAAAKAEAAWALADRQLANNWFRRATAEAPDDMATKVRWGDLFADTHQNAEAMEIYREVLAAEADNAYARLGAAHVLIDSFEAAAEEYLDELLSSPVTPDGPRLGALLLLARASLENGNRDESRSSLEEARDILARNDWPPLELLAIQAASDLLDGHDDSPAIAESLAYNPHYGGIYSTAAHYFVITRRYREAIDLYQKAVEIDPGLASAHEQMGINLLRDNQVSRARRHLEIAYKSDPFSPATVNTLRLLDSFVDFKLISEPSADGEQVPVTLRLHQDESAAISPYAIELIRQSIDVFTRRYEFTLREPVVVEMYPDHEDFAVRTAGMPGIGILGATFGYVIAMDSPSSRPAHQFQWGTTLWHEMAHVFTLEATGHLVPRWFSEGISVFEEWKSGPNPGVRIPMSVYSAMQEDRFLPIADLDEGFIRPTYEGQVLVSYMQAGLVCAFISSHYGDNVLREMLYRFGDGLDTRASVEQSLGIASTDFDEAFADYVSKEHGSVLERLDQWNETQARIASQAHDGNWQSVRELATEMIAILPGYVESDSPYLALARAERELGNADAATQALTTYWTNGGYDPAALARLARTRNDAGDPAAAARILYSAMLVDPLDIELHGERGEALLAAGDAAGALREFTVAIDLEPHDMATAWFRMAKAQYELGNTAASQEHLLQALDIAPGFRPAQRLLLKLAAESAN